ncbi:MAG: hypothetical protein KY475_03455 [Planctomycetes bacterium]|nr:hypothetical protein [Planctomycetota bacterium]
MCSAALLAAMAVLVTPLGQAEANPGDADAERLRRLEFMQDLAAEFSLHAAGGNEAPFRLHEAPVLRYSNPERERGSTDGATFLWLDGERPVAALSISIRKPDALAYCEATSFHPSPLICRRNDVVLWSPGKGSTASPLPEAPAPAASEPLRLTQMRQLARRFDARCFHPRTDASSQLRLLPQPLYRYADGKAGILDGAIFAFVVSNDPELLLMLEAHRDGDGAPAKWRFALARMSSHAETVQLDGREVWSVPNFYRSGESRTAGPYTESRLGIALP